jgi:hypothetical protein
MSDGLNVFQRINAIKERVAYVRKDKQVENYKAVTHDAVTAEVRPWFVEQGILILPVELSSHTLEVGKTQKGSAIYRFEAKYRIDFVNVDHPDDRLSIELTAHANDHGDKAPGKAVSYATKYAILKVLQLETGENEEGRQPQNLVPSDLLTQEELAGFLAMIKAAPDAETLKNVYKEAYSAASKDRESQALIIKAKDERKSELGGKP